ncbi:MAG TPA: CBS domain-containing protein [Anaeromyxobacter sp.]
MARDREPFDVEAMEGDEGEPEVGRHRDVGRACLQTSIAEVERTAPVTVPPDAPVARAVELMRARKVSAVLVVERARARRLVGIFTERDLVTRALPARGWAKARVERFMTRAPEALRARDPIAYAVNKMTLGGFRHVPVVDDAGRPAGMVSAGDVLQFVVELCPEEILNLPPEPELAVHARPEGE